MSAWICTCVRNEATKQFVSPLRISARGFAQRGHAFKQSFGGTNLNKGQDRFVEISASLHARDLAFSKALFVAAWGGGEGLGQRSQPCDREPQVSNPLARIQPQSGAPRIMSCSADGIAIVHRIALSYILKMQEAVNNRRYSLITYLLLILNSIAVKYITYSSS
ncbi:uncharacterized protein TRIREDRAFT_102567 [Trichoderma reesei QM6a]|uniref:Predicted protein n=1 Tax=Hypocrea jecorina (strain QM6a) TaxID=431241 RepID=G0R751_HYPJQ|nr:uncharacterized protein TRIREDRAFT_102567 [Trichoderma reesei QM6a]EGR52219.1 predicted protein [Trichoderma reesei QM6a]